MDHAKLTRKGGSMAFAADSGLVVNVSSLATTGITCASATGSASCSGAVGVNITGGLALHRLNHR